MANHNQGVMNAWYHPHNYDAALLTFSWTHRNVYPLKMNGALAALLHTMYDEPHLIVLDVWEMKILQYGEINEFMLKMPRIPQN